MAGNIHELRDMIANYHTHTTFSDGHADPEHYVETAIRNTMPALGFSDHAPVPFKNDFTMIVQRLIEYAEEIDRLANHYKSDIAVWKGLEVDYIPGMIHPGDEQLADADLDYTIGAVHYVNFDRSGRPFNVDGSTKGFTEGVHELFNGDFKSVVERYFDLQIEMINDHQPDILAHMDRIKRHNYSGLLFSTSEDWYRQKISEVLDAMVKNNTILEINTKGYYRRGEPEFYPSVEIIEMAFERGIPVHPAADAHRPEHIRSAFEDVLSAIEDIGYTHISQLSNSERWEDVPIAVYSR